MHRQDLMAFVAVAASLAIGTADTGKVRAGGYWNMPGTLSQRAGHGYSGGYHAPFILGPIKLDGWGAPNEVRLPCAPAPCCGCSCDCDGGRMLQAPGAIEGKVPTAMLPTEAQPVPSPKVSATLSKTAAAAPRVEPTRPLFDPPVQR